MLSQDRHVAGSRPFLASGTCKRENANSHAGLISTVIAACEEEAATILCPMYCIASDGESRRGSALTGLMSSHSLDDQSELYSMVGKMRLMDLSVGKNDVTVDKDPKHIFKRCRNLMLRKSGVLVDGVHLTPALLRFHLKDAGLSQLRINYLLNPTDRQDVPLAYTLLKEIWSLRDPQETDKPGFIAARKGLKILGSLFRHLVLPFIQITLSLREQLVHLSAAAHLATFLFTSKGAQSKAIQSLTYKDIILMVKNVFFCVAKAKISNPKGSFWLILLGTDRLEATFGLVRSMVGNDANADMLSLTTRLTHAVECLNIFSKHPDWDRGPHRLTLHAIDDGNGDILSKVDHISPASWKGDVQLDNVHPLTAWNEGRERVESAFHELRIADVFVDMEAKGHNMLHPFGNALADDDHNGELACEMDTSSQSVESMPPPSVLEEVMLGNGDPPDLSLEEHVEIETTRQGQVKYSPLVDIGDGKTMSKARILRELKRAAFSKVPGSTDRLSRVAGGTRFSGTVSANPNVIDSTSVFGTSTVCVGDPIATVVTCEGHAFLAIAHICDILVDATSQLEIDVKLLMETIVTIQFQICDLVEIVPSSESDSSQWRWTGHMEEGVLKTRGAFIQVVDPPVATEKVGEPRYLFNSEELRTIAASIFYTIPIEQRSLLPSLRKRSPRFPYRSRGMSILSGDILIIPYLFNSRPCCLRL